MRVLYCLVAAILIFSAIQCGFYSFQTPIEEVWEAGLCSDFSSASDGEDVEAETHAPLNHSLGEYTLLIWEVFPCFPDEFVTIKNVGSYESSLKDISISDGEGTATFTGNSTIEPGGVLTICSSLVILRAVGVMTSAIELSNLDTRGTLRLADKGDEIILLSPMKNVIDAFVFGDVDYAGEGWKGQPFDSIRKGDSARRKGSCDTNESGDWVVSVPGRSSLGMIECRSNVEPFIIPGEAEKRLLRELRYAQYSVILAFYQLAEPDIVNELCRCASNGVNVTILLEGQPVGGMKEEELITIGELLGSGVDIRLLESTNGYKRYRYLHCKYAVVDGRRTCVLSENLLAVSLQNNRGWGVIIESREIADYFSTLFELDSLPRMLDIGKADEKRFSASSHEVMEVQLLGNVAYPRFNCWVSPILSPDFSKKSLIEMVKDARERIMIQQMYCELTPEDELLAEIIYAAERGVKVRMLLDSSYFAQIGSNNAVLVEDLNLIASKNDLDLEARLVSEYHDFEILHNKGLIVDDQVLVSSINWCPSGFEENREVGVVLRSEEVAEFFFTVFLEDWTIDPLPPIARIEGSGRAAEGDIICLSALNSSDNAGISNYSWDIDGDGMDDRWGPLLVISLPVGNHIIRLRVTDIFNNTARCNQTIEVLDLKEGQFDPLLLLPLVAFAPFVFLRLLKKVKVG